MVKMELGKADDLNYEELYKGLQDAKKEKWEGHGIKKSPFRRCVDSLSQVKFDNSEYREIDKALCGDRPFKALDEAFKTREISYDRPFNEDIIDQEYDREREFRDSCMF